MFALAIYSSFWMVCGSEKKRGLPTKKKKWQGDRLLISDFVCLYLPLLGRDPFLHGHYLAFLIHVCVSLDLELEDEATNMPGEQLRPPKKDDTWGTCNGCILWARGSWDLRWRSSPPSSGCLFWSFHAPFIGRKADRSQQQKWHGLTVMERQQSSDQWPVWMKWEQHRPRPPIVSCLQQWKAQKELKRKANRKSFIDDLDMSFPQKIPLPLEAFAGRGRDGGYASGAEQKTPDVPLQSRHVWHRSWSSWAKQIFQSCTSRPGVQPHVSHRARRLIIWVARWSASIILRPSVLLCSLTSSGMQGCLRISPPKNKMSLVDPPLDSQIMFSTSPIKQFLSRKLTLFFCIIPKQPLVLVWFFTFSSNVKSPPKKWHPGEQKA